MLQENALKEGFLVEHVGCVDHILNVITKKCGHDPTDITRSPETGALKATRSLVGSFFHSTQLMEELLKLQRDRNETPVKVIQDVKTRWWSTYSMVLRILRVRVYINAMAPHHPKTMEDLNVEQWNLLECIKSSLEPFYVRSTIS
jgi:hypothetical protein